MWWALPALAALPPPDYRARLVGDAEDAADALLSAREPEAALELVRGFREHVADHPRLVYEEALATRLMGDVDGALRLCEQAVAADPTLAAAWYDLGEARLLQGDLDAAEPAFQKASDLTPDHPNGWAGPFRLAEVAARRNRPEAFDAHLREALRRGFRFQTVLTDPRWRSFLADPALGEVIRRLALAYGQAAVLEQWE